MRYLLSFVLLVVLVITAVPTTAQTDCDPAAIIAQANALKSSGDEQKDMAALLELVDSIQNMNSDCAAGNVAVRAEKGTGERTNPIPLNAMFSAQSNEGKNTFDIRFTKVVRGDDALKMVVEANSFNDPPPDGQEYLLAYFEFNYLTGDEKDPYTISKYDFSGFSNGQFLENSSVVLPKPSLDVKAFPGAKANGWIMINVLSDDAKPLIFLGSTYSGDGLYFATW